VLGVEEKPLGLNQKLIKENIIKRVSVRLAKMMTNTKK
jgi:hypothetical protein